MANYLTEQGALKKRLQQSIANQQASFLGQQRGKRRMDSITRKYQEGLQPTLSSYGQRGLGGPAVQSGIMRRGLTRYAENMQNEIGAENQNLQEELNSIAMQDAAQQADLEDFLQALRLQKQQDILSSAMEIKNLGAF